MKKINLHIVSLILYIIVIILILKWYDYKLLIILIIFNFGNNIEQRVENNKKFKKNEPDSF